VPTVEGMEIWVLGTLEVSHDGRPVPVRGTGARQLLALLARTPGVEVTTRDLVRAIFGTAAPLDAEAKVHARVARLRRELPQPGAVRRGAHGYVLDAERVDASTFERGVQRGCSALRSGRLDDASRILGEALSLWRGTPYAEFTGCEVLAAEAERLTGLRLDALAQSLVADLERTDGEPSVAELEALVRWHPHREQFWVLLVVAQYRAGRQVEALDSLCRARGALDLDGPPVTPSVLDELERLVVDRDPSLETSVLSRFVPLTIGGRAYPEPVALVERAPLLETLSGLHDEALAGSGRLVLVHGEAGAGKSALLRAFEDSASSRSPVLRGACDPLTSPRPLGPLVDLAPHLDPSVGDLLRRGERDGLFELTLASLSERGPVVVLVEDVHWADASTLDLLRFLARRLEGTPVLVVVTYRDDDLPPAHPLRVLLGDLASSPVVRRVPVPPLSRDAVAVLVGDQPVDVDALHRETGGNAFFVTEVVASGGDVLPPTVQAAVLARTHRLSPQAQLALESAAVIGSRIEPSLIHGMPDGSAEAVDECVAAGMLTYEAPTYAFRHELVRQSVLSLIPPGRLGALHWQALDRLRTLPMSPKPVARLAEHAHLAGDPQAILEYAVAAGDSAARLGAHREAAAQYGRAMPYAELLDLDARCELLFKRTTECDVSDQLREAIDSGEALVSLLRGTDRVLDLGSALMSLSHAYYTIGLAAESAAREDEGVELLESLPPGPALALAYAARAGTFMVANRYDEAILWAERALSLADRVGCVEASAQALNTLGVSRAGLGDPAGEQLLLDSLRLARENGLEHIASRGYTNLSFVLDVMHRHDDSLEVLEEGIVYSEEHDLHSSMLCSMATHTTLLTELGEWDRAVDEARDLLYVRDTSRISRIEPLLCLALIGARRGRAPGVWALLDEALDLASGAEQLQYAVPVAVARAEVRLLGDDPEGAVQELLEVHGRAVALRSHGMVDLTALWLWRAGQRDVAVGDATGPEALAMTGMHREAAAVWRGYGFPYAEAWALLDSDAELDVREARALFDRLGAQALVDRSDARLRSLGAKVPRGARASTRANVGGLTDREVDVLDLVDQGLRNAEIAARLHLSEKTVGHHVSAILGKLGASSRTEAVRRARDLAAGATSTAAG